MWVALCTQQVLLVPFAVQPANRAHTHIYPSSLVDAVFEAGPQSCWMASASPLNKYLIGALVNRLILCIEEKGKKSNNKFNCGLNKLRQVTDRFA